MCDKTEKVKIIKLISCTGSCTVLTMNISVPVPMVVLSKVLSLTAGFLSPLAWFEFQSGI